MLRSAQGKDSPDLIDRRDFAKALRNQKIRSAETLRVRNHLFSAAC